MYSNWIEHDGSNLEIIVITNVGTFFFDQYSILNKKDRYIKFSLKLSIFHLNIVQECI